MSDEKTVVTCVKSGEWGYIIYGTKVSVKDGIAHLEFPFRDDIVEANVPESEVQTLAQCCTTCKHRLQHLITNGECPGQYAPVTQLIE